MPLITPEGWPPSGHIPSLPQQLMRTLTSEGRGQIKEAVNYMALEDQTKVTAGAVVCISRSGVVAGSYFILGHRRVSCKLDPAWFGVPEELKGRMDLSIKMDLSKFIFPSAGPHRNLSQWMEGNNRQCLPQSDLFPIQDHHCAPCSRMVNRRTCSDPPTSSKGSA